MSKKSFLKLILASSLFAAAALCAAAHAEEVSPTRDWSALDFRLNDEAWAQALQEERAGRGPGRGVFLINAAEPGCGAMLAIGRPRDPVKVYAWGLPRAVSSGDYYVLALECRAGNSRTVFNGPHAKFQVRRGEFVDLGTLDFQHTKDDGFLVRTGTAVRTIKPTSPENLAQLKAKFPRLMSTMVSRPMTLIGPAEVRTR